MSNRESDSARDGRRTSRELVEDARIEGVDATSNKRLFRLIGEWEGAAVALKRGGAEGKAEGLAEAAQELKELIEDAE